MTDHPIHAAATAAATPRLTPTAPAAAEGLPRLTREIIVLTTLLQGVLVYGWVEGWWGGGARGVHIGLTTVIAVPAFFVLCVVQLRDRLLWASMAVVALLVLGLNASVWWMGAGEQDTVPWSLWGVWLCCLAALLLIALSWVQALLQHRSLRHVPYRSLFEQAWNNAMVLPFAALFVGLCWGVLALWAGLFALLKVEFFAETFTQPAFICMATGLMAGLGVLMARGQPKALRMMLQLVLALFKLLLPLLALVMVLFVLFLPFTGLQPLWDTGHATVLLCYLLLCLVLGVNAVYQDGSAAQSPYPAPVQWLVQAAVVLMPVLALLAVWGLGLRVGQYGWTVQRIGAAVVVGVLLLYSVGYAAAALRVDAVRWLSGIARWNPGMSWLVMALLVLLHTPVLDPYRISAQHQRDRLAQGQAPVSLSALEQLRFGHGRHGVPALQFLQTQPLLADAQSQQWLAQVIAAHRRSARAGRPSPTAQALAQPVAEQLQLAPAHESPPADWWAAVEAQPLRSSVQHCLREEVRCMVLQLPLESTPGQQPGQGAQLELNPLVCRVGSLSPNCQVFGRQADSAWQRVGQLSWGGVPSAQRALLEQAIEEGRLQTQPPRWQEVVVPGLDARAGQVRE